MREILRQKYVGGCLRKQEWPRQQESNLHLGLRRAPFYPLNYGEDACVEIAQLPDCTLAQVSRKVTVRLNTGRVGNESLSAQK